MERPIETRWIYTPSPDFPALLEASKGVCVIPMGCVEKHGLHLPVGADIFEASEITYRASLLEPVCVFPDFTFGDVSCNAPVHPNGYMPAGTITLSLETEILLLEELCEQISRNGFKKILIANGHGGNKPWLSTFLRKLANKKHDFVCVTYMVHSEKSPYYLAEQLEANGSGSIPELTPEDEQVILDFCRAKKEVGHACMGETSVIMGLHPKTVHLERLGIESGLSTHAADYLKAVGIEMMDSGWGQNFPFAYHGHDPIGCNERIGKASVRVQSERLARAIKVMKDDENLLRWNAEMQRGW